MTMSHQHLSANSPMGLQYLALVAQTNKLLNAVSVYSSSICLHQLEEAFQGQRSPSIILASASDTDVSSEMALVAALVLHSSMSKSDATRGPQQLPSNCSQIEVPQQPGAPTIAWIAAHTGMPSCTSATVLHQQLACSSLVQLQLARDMCASALMLSLQPHNCFSLMAVATVAVIPQLATAARLYALTNFAEAMKCDAIGFSMLSPDQLLSLLSDDTLKCSSEIDVFIALMSWYQSQPANTDMSGLAALSRQCVRNGLLSLKELEVLDAQVDRNEEALMLVAGWYIDALFGAQTCQHRPRTPRESATASTC